jgi:hypothetical protein
MWARVLGFGWIVWLCDFGYFLSWTGSHDVLDATSFEILSFLAGVILFGMLLVASVAALAVSSWREHRRWR